MDHEEQELNSNKQDKTGTADEMENAEMPTLFYSGESSAIDDNAGEVDTQKGYKRLIQQNGYRNDDSNSIKLNNLLSSDKSEKTINNLEEKVTTDNTNDWNSKQQRDLICYICQEHFDKVKKLKFHLAEHSPSKLFPCKGCGKIFRFPLNIRRCCKKVTEKPFTCKLCRKWSVERKILKKRAFSSKICKNKYLYSFKTQSKIATR